MREPSRRVFLATLGGAALSCGTSGTSVAEPRAIASTPSAAPPPAAPRTVRLLDWTFPSEMGGGKRATVLLPEPLDNSVKLPVLIALHGLGETSDPATGANGWPRAYALETVYQRLLAPPLYPDDFQNLVTSERLREVNEELAARPLGGVIVVCPYLPRDIGGATPIELYTKWLEERLLPRVRAELPAATDARATGIDGVSLGGWTAMRIGLARPDLFGVIGALQPALLDWPMVDWAMSLITSGLRGRPFRFVTSTDDVYRPTLVELDRRLTAQGIAHEFAITPGPHDYPWNKGPGGIEMMLFHDRKLRA